MSFNVWQPQGAVILSTGANFTPFLPNVIYEGNAQILSGNVFKMWYYTLAGLAYAESVDGLTSWTPYSSNPVLATTVGAKIYKHGTTYYCFANPFSSYQGGISVYTSPDGIAWTLQASAVLSPEGSGWEKNFVTQMAISDVIGGTWYGYYAGQAADGSYKIGLATSTDGLHWTKGANNPVAAFSSGTLLDGSPWMGANDLCFKKVNGIYYGWSQVTATADPGSSSNLPSGITRWSSPSALGPWTPINSITYYRNSALDGVGNPEGQVADPSIVEVSGQCYLYYSAVQDQSGDTDAIACATASMTLAQLVKTYEGIQNIPIPHSLSLNLSPIATDNFTRADSNPISGNWEQTFSGTGTTVPSQIVSNTLRGTVLAMASDEVSTVAGWPDDQFSQVTVDALVSIATESVIIPLRVTNANSATPTYIRVVLRIESMGTMGYLVQSVVGGGSFATITSGTFTPSAGDVYTVAVVAASIYFYQNQSLLFVSDAVTSQSSGAAGCGVTPQTSLANASLSLWSGGGFKDAPSPRPVHGKRSTRSK